MVSVAQKAEYVRGQAKRGAGDHHCHWPGCREAVPPAMWGCKPHWMKLPARLRTKIWRAYQPGQEINKRPSKEYVAIAREAQDWIAKHYGIAT